MVLRRGATVTGQVVGPDGQTIREVWLFTRGLLAPGGEVIRRWDGQVHGTTRNGRFELSGLDPDTEVRVYFLDPKRKLGIAVKLSGKSAAAGPMTIRLEPCGAATARTVDTRGKAVAGPLVNRAIVMVMTPGRPFNARRQAAGLPTADEADLSRVDPVNYPTRPSSDKEGRLTLPVLIPGAEYRFLDYTGAVAGQNGPAIRKEFTVKPGETVDLGDIVIEKPKQ